MRLIYLLPCLSMFALAGCGPGSGSLSGKVTYQGKPLSGGKVTFLTADQKVKTAMLQLDGSYTLDKVPAGPVKIAVDPPMAPAAATMGMDPSKMGAPQGAAPPPPPSKPASLPAHYQDLEKSELTYTVVQGKQEHNIELK